MTYAAILVVVFMYFAFIFGQILGYAFRASEPLRDQEVFDACLLRPDWKKR